MASPGFTEAHAEALLTSVVNLGLVAYATTLDACGRREAATRPTGEAAIAWFKIEDLRERALRSDRVRDGLLHAVRGVPYAEARALADRASEKARELEALAEDLRTKGATMQPAAQVARIGADVLAIFAGLVERRHEVVS